MLSFGGDVGFEFSKCGTKTLETDPGLASSNMDNSFTTALVNGSGVTSSSIKYLYG